ncbi:MAG TPA: tetratricopeptide repeat protein [Candidatus Wunengus sp. YC60]|uniref:tetratricopeptide repeat protein n=1 Tax=Candidatus Wunengus sp. YC60 TaxID=3367697 RepID=UPI004029CD31
MKYFVAILPGFLLAASMLGCSKDDTTSPKAGIIYNSGDIGGEATGNSQGSRKHNAQQLNDKLRSMSNDDLFQLALDCGNQGNCSEALAAYNKILETDKNYPDLYYYQGLLYRDMGMLDEAVCAFQTAITQNPASAEAHYNLGYAFRCKGLHNEAVPEYRKALELIPENKTKQKAYIHFNLGFSYFSNGMIDDAIGQFKKALAYKPKDKEIHQKLGIAYTAKGWTEKAKDEFSLYHEQDKPIKKIP